MLMGLTVVVLAVTAAATIGLARRARDGRLRASDAVESRHTSALRALGVDLAAPVTLVSFATPVCAPCRAARRVCAEAADRVPGVATLEVDVDTNLDAVRALGVWRAPTLLVVDSNGNIALRAAGVPSLEDLLAAVQPLVVARREARGASAASPAVANEDQQ